MSVIKMNKMLFYLIRKTYKTLNGYNLNNSIVVVIIEASKIKVDWH